jgi:hypothetical protein
MPVTPSRLFGAAFLLASAVAVVHCSGSSPSGSGDGGVCFPDGDGVSGGYNTFDLTVDDTGFSKSLLNTQNDARITLTLKNTGTKPHGFAVGCTSVASEYPNLPASCPTMACFPSGATIAPLAPGASATVVFSTPTPDVLIYPFTSNEPADSAVPALNNGQWSLM